MRAQAKRLLFAPLPLDLDDSQGDKDSVYKVDSKSLWNSIVVKARREARD